MGDFHADLSWQAARRSTLIIVIARLVSPRFLTLAHKLQYLLPTQEIRPLGPQPNLNHVMGPFTGARLFSAVMTLFIAGVIRLTLGDSPSSTVVVGARVKLLHHGIGDCLIHLCARHG